MKPLVLKALELATQRIGVREIGNTNSGTSVSRWLKQVGAPDYSPWCAAFSWCCIDDAATALGVVNPFLKSAYTPDIGAWAVGQSILIPATKDRPQAGDCFLVCNSIRFHHIGFVRSVQGNSWTSIEGNANSTGSAEGYEVASNANKPFASRYYWVRWSALCADEKAAPSTRSLFLGGVKVADLPVAGNVSLCPVRKWCHWMGAKLAWVGGETPIEMNGRPLESDITLMDGSAYVPIRDLTTLDPSLLVRYDAASQSVYVERVPAKAGA